MAESLEFSLNSLSLQHLQRLYHSAFGLKVLSNVNDKAALAKKASNPPVHVNWEAVISPTEAMERAFTSQENEFYNTLRDLVGKGEVNPSEWVDGGSGTIEGPAPSGVSFHISLKISMLIV